MAADFRKRFWISLALTPPILVLSPMLQTLVGLRDCEKPFAFQATSSRSWRGDPDNIEKHLVTYIKGFSASVRRIFVS